MKAKHLVFPTFVALATVLPASADIIYSNFQNIDIPATFDGVYLDVDGGNGSNTDMANPVAGWDINPFYGGRSVANSPAFQPVRSGTGSSSPIVKLAAGASVGTGSVFSTFVQGAGGENPGGPGYGGSQMLTGSGGNFTAGQEGYLGFRLNGSNYGWMRAVFTDNNTGSVIKDYAYDNTTGTTIKAGLIQTNVTAAGLTTTTLNPGASDSFVLASVLNNGVLSGGYTNSVLKQGNGTVTFTQANTYTGATAINAGKLVVNGNQPLATGATTVAAGTTTGNPVATLSGNGGIGGNLTLAPESAAGFKNGGVLAPTASASGTALDVAGTTTFGTGSIFEWNIDAAPGSAGLTNQGSYGQLAGTGAISGNDAIFKIVLGTNAFTDAFWDTNKTWTNVISGTGATTALDTLFTSFDTSNGISSTGAVTGQGQFSFSGTNTLNWSAVPEPTSALAGLLIGAGLLRRRRSTC